MALTITSFNAEDRSIVLDADGKTVNATVPVEIVDRNCLIQWCKDLVASMHLNDPAPAPLDLTPLIGVNLDGEA